MGKFLFMGVVGLILASIVREFRLSPLPGHTPMPVGRLTIRSESGVRLRIHARATRTEPAP